MTDSILNINVSCFAHCKATTPAEVSLLSWLTSDKYRDKVEQIRAIQDEGLQKDIKKTLPAITPSGVFSYRDTENLIYHTGFMTFDIDADKNPQFDDFAWVRDQVSRIVHVAYCGLSVRGQGCWGLVPIPKSTPVEHRQRFDALAKDFSQYGITLDPACSDVCRLRIYSWDPDAYFCHDALLYTKILKPQPPRHLPRPPKGDTRDRVEAIISQVKERQIDITTDYKSEWFGLAAALANEFGEGGRGYFHTLSQFHPEYRPDDTDKLFDSVLRKSYTDWSIGTLFTVAKNHGITLRSEAPLPLRPMERREPAQSEEEPDECQGEVPTEQVTSIEAVRPVAPEKILPDLWGVEALEAYFRTRELPEGPVTLDDCTVIEDVTKFIDAEMAIVKSHNGNPRYLPYMDRLLSLKNLIN